MNNPCSVCNTENGNSEVCISCGAPMSATMAKSEPTVQCGACNEPTTPDDIAFVTDDGKKICFDCADGVN